MNKREHIIKELRKHFEDLLISNKYYISIPLGDIDSVGDEYWGIVKDPDGIIRDRHKEKNHHLEDINYIINYIEHLKPGKILDIGCGPGWLLSSISNEWVKYGNEIDERAIEISDDDSISFSNQQITKGLFNDNYFDVIVMHHVIEHVPDPIGFIKSVKRILKPGGTLILGTPDFDSGCARLFGPKYRLLHDPTHISLFSNDSMHRFLRDFGFQIVRVDYPFFNTRFFTEESLLRLFNNKNTSPPFYGNFMTFFCENK